jgi:hypothetical protein
MKKFVGDRPMPILRPPSASCWRLPTPSKPYRTAGFTLRKSTGHSGSSVAEARPNMVPASGLRSSAAGSGSTSPEPTSNSPRPARSCFPDEMRLLQGHRLGMREPSRHALGWRACRHLRRRRDALSAMQSERSRPSASAAGLHAYRIRQEGLASLAAGVGHANSTTRSHLPDGGKLRTLRDAATHVTALPKKEAALPEWQAVIEALILVADLGGPTMFARIGVVRER